MPINSRAVVQTLLSSLPVQGGVHHALLCYSSAPVFPFHVSRHTTFATLGLWKSCCSFLINKLEVQGLRKMVEYNQNSHISKGNFQQITS